MAGGATLETGASAVQDVALWHEEEPAPIPLRQMVARVVTTWRQKAVTFLGARLSDNTGNADTLF